MNVASIGSAPFGGRCLSWLPQQLRQAFGEGQVTLTTPHYLQAFDGQEELAEGERRFTVLLEVAKDLLTHCVGEFLPVEVSGPPIEYLVNHNRDGFIVTLVNNEPAEWRGTVFGPGRDGDSQRAVTELWEDVAVPSRLQGSQTVAEVTVPAWGFKVISFQRA